MELELGMHMAQTMELLENFSGESVFPKTEKVLVKIKYQYSDEYRSASDSFLCKVCPSFKKNCIDFYEGKGAPLRKMMSKKEIRNLDSLLHKAIQHYIGKKS